MTDKILFQERQKFRKWWFWLILLGLNGLFLYGVFRQIIGGQQFGDKPMSNAGLLTVTALTMILTVFLISLRLETIIRPDGIYVRFFPVHLRFRHYTWDTLIKSYVRRYSPISEYGGWGLRFGLMGKGNAWNVSGNKGLQLQFINNKLLLIGTQKPDELSETLNKIGQLKP